MGRMKIFKSLYVRLLRMVRYPYITHRDLSTGELIFVDKNRSFWRSVFGQRPESHDGYILVDLRAGNDYQLHYIASLATIASEVHNLRPLSIIPHQLDSAHIKVLNSYTNFKIIVLGKLRHIVYVAFAYLQAWKTYRTFKTPEDVLKFQVDGIQFGDLIYDNVLYKRYATISKVDNRVFKMLWNFYYYRFNVKYMMQHYKISSAFVTHVIGIQVGVFVRYLLQRNITVVLCRCIKMTNLRKYHDLAEAWEYPLRPCDKWAPYLLGFSMDTICEKAQAYLNQRFYGDSDNLDARLAFGKGKKTYKEREEFALKYGLDSTKKNVFVMLHAFNDHPHMLGVSSGLYIDYYEWFINTLRIAQSVSSVNWIFKEHPSNAFYPTYDLDLNKVFSAVKENHVIFLTRDEDFSARSIAFLGDVIVTCIGTAGMEYSSIGIPCVLGGRSPYSGFGFTIEPQTKAEYEHTLKRVDQMESLDVKQIRTAQVIMYFELCMALNSPLFLVEANHESYGFLDEEYGDEFWHTIAQKLSDLDMEYAKHEIGKLQEFIEDDSLVQYIDLDINDFMREVIGDNSGGNRQGPD